jgi:undecaprenyl-diphosphatase
MDVRSARRDAWPWVGLACALAFLVLATLVVRRGGLAFDEPFAAALQALPIPAWFWEACTFLGGPILVPIGVAFVLAALLTGRVRLALIVAVVLIAATLFTDLVKEYVARPRPPGEPLVSASGYSFPSGHTLNSTATYGLLALVALWSRLPLAIRRAAVIAGVTLPFLVGLSRIALGVHYPTDVLGGWLAGVAFVALAATLIRLTGAMERDLPRRKAEVPASEP